MISQPVVRAARTSDISAMVKLSVLADTAAQWTEQQYAQIFSEGSDRQKTLVAERDSQILGLLVARGFEGEWEIENIVVGPAIQRHGVGTLMLKEFMKFIALNSPSRLFMEVRESNGAARALYENNGFKQTRRRKNYYSNPNEDALIYRYDLP
jgi:ribosomal-protein-alanine N-acetyltransferase